MVQVKLKCISGLLNIDKMLEVMARLGENPSKQFGRDSIISLEADGIKIEMISSKPFSSNYTVCESFVIPESRIIDIDIITAKNIEEKSKSVIGRGLVGAAVFGPVGAFVGGLSGIGSKQAVSVSMTMCIIYEKANGDGCGNIVFRVETSSEIKGASDFVAAFNIAFDRVPQIQDVQNETRDERGNIIL